MGKPLNPDLSAFLARWHSWRAGYSPERAFARAQPFHVDSSDDERELMGMLDGEIDKMPRDVQLMLQHLAQAHYLGVDVFKLGRIPDHGPAREALETKALDQLDKALLRLGLL